MFKVRINGTESDIVTDGSIRFTDLIELVKATIDPEHMITSILVDGRDLAEEDWAKAVGQITGDQMDVLTGTPLAYVNERLGETSGVVRSCFLSFRDARKDFQDGDMMAGNKKLKVAVDSLKAFFEWYGTLLQLMPERNRDKLDITPHVVEISDTCKKICQQQLYQSWWALGESLEKDLEPKLDQLEDVCRRVARTVHTSM